MVLFDKVITDINQARKIHLILHNHLNDYAVLMAEAYERGKKVHWQQIAISREAYYVKVYVEKHWQSKPRIKIYTEAL